MLFYVYLQINKYESAIIRHGNIKDLAIFSELKVRKSKWTYHTSLCRFSNNLRSIINLFIWQNIIYHDEHEAQSVITQKPSHDSFPLCLWRWKDPSGFCGSFRLESAKGVDSWSQLNLIHTRLIIIPAGYARVHTRVSRLIRPIGTQRRVVSRLFRV